MPPMSQQLNLTISLKELAEFELAIATACMMRSHDRLENRLPQRLNPENFAVPYYFYRGDGSLVVSFGRGWYPFLDNTRGYNQGSERWYVPKISGLLAGVGRAMQTPEQRQFLQGQSGGRVFLHSTGALRAPSGVAEFELLTWKLPTDSHFLRDRNAANS